MSLLEVEELSVCYRTPGTEILAVRDISFAIDEGELVAMVGESGSGKSTVAHAVVGALPASARHSGTIRFDGRDLMGLSAAEMRAVRRHGVALMPQNGLNALNPVLNVGAHFYDVLRSHGRVKRAQARARGAELLARVGLDRDVLDRYPHQLSGGMRQRVCLAIVLSLEPRLIVFDEPTTALDVLTQQHVMATVAELQRAEGFAGILVSHDLGLALERTTRSLIVYAGRIVEERSSAAMLDDARHPYTRALISCYGDPQADVVALSGIPGDPPDLSLGVESACAFAPRCRFAADQCFAERPPLRALDGGGVACHRAEQLSAITPRELNNVG
jgi:oligopeptide/dipeptide ABC transporter ATP-binding protein